MNKIRFNCIEKFIYNIIKLIKKKISLIYYSIYVHNRMTVSLLKLNSIIYMCVHILISGIILYCISLINGHLQGL